jgi:tyrosinase
LSIHKNTNQNRAGPVPVRREIRDLQSNYPDIWNLYLLGLDAFQKMNENDLTSYYQIAGIHGMPYKPWNGVNGRANMSGFGGYCTHSSTIFITWHRPYLALYEQYLYAVVQGIATSFPEPLRARYVAAAKDFRVPYYDWALLPAPGRSSFPSSISSSKINVTGADGKPTQIDNPLYSFRFHPINPSPGDFTRAWSSIPATVRYPDSQGQSNNNSVASAVSNENASLRRNISLLLQSYTRFNAFSNNAWLRNERPGEYGSLENIHDNLHGIIGGGGHMGALDVSAFDPIFWLHHCNVDRMAAIWQAVHPSSFVEAGRNSLESFTTARGAVEDMNTQLKPFWDGSGTKFWTSTGAKETTTFGYAYPETQKWRFPSEAEYQRNVNSTIIQMYGGGNVVRDFVNAMAVSPAPVTQLMQKMAIGKGSEAPKANNPGHGGPSLPKDQKPLLPQEDLVAESRMYLPIMHPLLSPTKTHILTTTTAIPDKLTQILAAKKYTEWVTNLRALKHGLNQTFQVFVFLGDFSPDPKTWPFERTMVGRFTVLGRKSDTPCSKCADDMLDDLVVTGTVPLTAALLQDIVDGQVPSLDEADVEPYLVKNLHWRVTVFDGSEWPRDQVPGLKVGVCSTRVTVGEADVPVYGDQWRMHEGITDGRPAGHGVGDQV